MNWKIFLYRAKIDTELPFDTLIGFIKRKSNKGDKFKIKTVDNRDAKVLYAYRQGITERLGYYAGPTNEIIINGKRTEDNKVTIDFKFSNSVLIGLGLISTFVLIIGLFAMPDFGLYGSGIALLTIYFWGVVRLNSQFYYFKSDLDQMEENFKRQVGQ
jgi:hypothetical protein